MTDFDLQGRTAADLTVKWEHCRVKAEQCARSAFCILEDVRRRLTPDEYAAWLHEQDISPRIAAFLFSKFAPGEWAEQATKRRSRKRSAP